MRGRPRNKGFEELNFDFVKDDKKYTAFCRICNRSLMNTAYARLKTHRNFCVVKVDSCWNENTWNNSNDEAASENNDQLETPNGEEHLDVIEEYPKQFHSIATETVENKKDSQNVIVEPSASYTQPFSSSVLVPNANKRKGLAQNRSIIQPSKKTCIQKVVAQSNSNSAVDEDSNFNDELANLIFGCNLSLSTVESVHFKNFIEKLRPNYVSMLPSRETLATTILDKSFEECMAKTKQNIQSESILIVSSVKNMFHDATMIVCLLHSMNGSQNFLKSWDLINESKTAFEHTKIIVEAVKMTKDLYDSNIFAVVSNITVKKDELESRAIWHCMCNEYIANLLADDIFSTNSKDYVLSLLKNFKQLDLEPAMLAKGGSAIEISESTNWRSFHNNYKYLLANLEVMRQVAKEQKSQSFKDRVAQFLFDNVFITEVTETIEMVGFIEELTKECRQPNSSVADAVNLWLNLKMPNRLHQKLHTKLKERREMALNSYALSAFYFHPAYEEKKLMPEHIKKINDFLFTFLDGDGMEDWDSFSNCTGVFKILKNKGIVKPKVYWNMVEKQHPSLAGLVKKLIAIPASSTQIGQDFSNCSYQRKPDGKLDFDLSQKLMHVFCSLNSLDNCIP